MAIRLPAGVTREQAAKLLASQQGISIEQAAQLISKPGYEPTKTQYEGLQEALAKTTVPTVSGVGGSEAGVSFGKIDLTASKPGGKVELPEDEQVVAPSKPATGITLSLSDKERQVLATKQAQATCAADVQKYEPKVYKATLKGGGIVFVEATSKKVAKERATEAGYNVAWVTWSPKYEATTTELAASIDRFKDSKGNYDLIGIANALRTGEITSQEVSNVFSSKGSHEVSIARDILTKLEPYKTGDGYLLSAALADRAISTYEANKVFSSGVVDNAISNRASAATLSRYKDTSGNYDLIAISEALQSGRIKEDTITSILGNAITQEAKSIGDIIKKLEPYKSGDDYFLADALKEGAITKSEAREIFSNETMTQVTIGEAFATQKMEGAPDVSGKYTAPAIRGERKAFPVKEAALIAADIVVPYVYVARHWKELPVWERALWITLDTALFIIPMAGAGVRGARGIAVAAKEAGRLARVGGALKNIGREALIMVRAPVDAIMHPVAATKQGIKDFRSVVENVVRGRKIPEAVLTTTEGTVRLSITNATSADEFMRVRDALIKAAAQGDMPVIALRDKAGKTIANLQLAEAPLMRELKGGVVHTTPWGEKFRAGLRVEAMANLPLAEQGLFVSHEPLPRFARQSAFNLPVEIGQRTKGGQTITTRFGANQVVNIHLRKELPKSVLQDLAKSRLVQVGDDLIQPLGSKNIKKLTQALRESDNVKAAIALEQTVDSYKPIFRIMSPDKAKEIIASGKTYRGAVELEAKLPVGAKILPPKQILVTRIGPESTEVQLWLDKALTKKQIAKLKLEGLLEAFRQPFRFPLKITDVKGKLTPIQVKQLTAAMRDAGNPAVARSLERAYRLTKSGQRMAQVAGKVAALIVARTPQRAVGITRPEGVELVRAAEWLERAERPAEVIRTKTGKVVRRPPRAERAERVTRPRRTERATRTERPSRIERTTRAERPSRAERPTRGERLERPVRGERPVRPIRPERPVRPVRRKRPTKVTRLFDMPPVKGKKKFKREGPPLAVWDQGMYYVTVFPPFRTKGREPGKPGKPDVVYSREKPPWATKTVKGKRSPQRSLQTFGKVPVLLEVPMGKVTARIHHGRKLTFSRSNGRRRGRIIE